MRASTLFALTIAVLLGLGAAVAARMSGIFTKAPDAPVQKKTDIQILVAAKNLFAGDTIDTIGVRVRPIKAEEMDHYLKHKDEYLPTIQTAAAMRIPKVDILADQPILAKQLEDLNKPSALNTRLMPSMRAVSLSATKEQSAGGLIQTGEWVDVLLTSNISDSIGRKTTKTAVIAPRVRVVAKRNTLWPVFAPLPNDKPLQFTLEVNPYRAALLEFAKTKGMLTLIPLPGSEQKRLEEQRSGILKNPDQISPVVFGPDGQETKDEEIRVATYAAGLLVVDEHDLVRIFNLTTPPPPEPPQSLVAIEQLSGINHYQPASFNQAGARMVSTKNKSGGSNVHNPANHGGGMVPIFEFRAPECPTCGNNKKGKVQ